MRLLSILLSLFVAETRAAEFSVKASDIKALVESRNERVQAKAKEKTAATLREGFLSRSFLPSAEIYGAQETFKKGSHAVESQPTYGGEVRLNLFNGWRDSLEEERRSYVSERKRYEKLITLTEELSKARETYWRIVYFRDYIELLQEARKNSAESLKSAERRIRSGVATDTDRLEFEMQDIDLKRELEKAELEHSSLKRFLRVLLGAPADANLEVVDELAHEHDWEDLLKHTEEDHAFFVKPAELQAKETSAQSRAAARSWLPKVDAFAAYNQFNQREEDSPSAAARKESVIGLRLTISLFDGLAQNREASALAAEASAAEFEAEYLRQQTEAHFHGEISELKLLHAQVHEAEANVKRAETYHRLTQSEYSRGVKNSPDMVGAMEKLVLMRQKRLEIVRDFQISKSHVLAKIGR